MNGTGSRASSWLNWAQQPREAGGLGLAPHQAAGVVGNLVKESGNDLPSWGPTGDNGTAWGTAQWRNERLASLKQMYPDSYQTTEAQQAFMRHEMDTTHNGAYQALLASKTPEEAATAFNRKYEISADNTGGREAAARQLMAQFGGGDASSGEPGALTSAFASTTSNQKSSMPTPALSPDAALGQGALTPTEDPNDRFYQGMMGLASSLAGISNPDQAKAIMAQSQLSKKAQGSWSHQIMPNGQLMMSNTNGQTKIIGKPGDYSKDDTYQPIMGKDDMGNPTILGGFNKNTNEFTPIKGTGAAAPSAFPPTFEELQQTNPALANQVQDVETGKLPYPKGGRLNPQQAQLRQAMSIYRPGVDANVYDARRQFLTDDAKSAPQSFGGQLQKTNTALGLLEDVADHYGKIGNTRSALGSTAATVENYITSGGDTQGSLRQKLDVAAQNAAADINSLQNAGRGSVGEREHIKEGLYLPYSSPREQAGALQGHIDTLKKAVDAKFEHEAKQMGPDFVEKDPRYQEYKKRIDVLQTKADKLYNADFSYAKGGDAPAAAAPASPAIDHSAIDAEMKRRGL